MLYSELRNHVRSDDSNIMLWSSSGVYRVCEKDWELETLTLENLYGISLPKIVVNGDNCEDYHSKVRNPEIKFALELLEQTIRDEIKEQLSDF